MANAKTSASATADENLSTGATVLVGFNAVETAGTPAAAEVALRDGSATGQVLARVKLAASESVGESYPHGLRAPNGIFVDRVSGTTEVTVYVE